METKESQESLQSRLSFVHRGRLFSSDRDDSSDSDDYLETGLYKTSYGEEHTQVLNFLTVGAKRNHFRLDNS